jgi:hypothetical protein
MQVSEYCQMALLNLMKPGINSIVSKRFRVNWFVEYSRTVIEVSEKQKMPSSNPLHATTSTGFVWFYIIRTNQNRKIRKSLIPKIEKFQFEFLNHFKDEQSLFSFQDWRVSLTYKLSYYLAITYYCSGLIAEESKKYGQSVCYYEAAVERLKEAWKTAEKISSDRTNVFKDAHVFTNDVLMGK